MIRLLMFGSSHSACFEKLSISGKLKLNIFAAMGDHILQFLRVNENGEFYLDDSASDWDKEIFFKSGAGAPQLLSCYDYIVLNTKFDLDLPMLMHGDLSQEEIDSQILSASNSLCNSVLQLIYQFTHHH